MRPNTCTRYFVPAIAGLLLAFSTACTHTQEPASASASSEGGKIPITTKSEEAKNEFLQGRALAEKLQAQDSLAHFDHAIALDPEFAMAELARCNASPTAKEFFDHQQKAVKLADKVSEGEKLLILANQAAANGDVNKQREYLEKLVAQYPGDERAQFNLGGYYFGQQEFAQAVEHYKKATEIAPDYSPAYNILGYADRQQGDYANAEQAFKKYIELIPNDPNPYDSYAELLLKMGKFEESITQYRKALAIDPHFLASRFGISADLTYMGKPQEANAELQTMIDQARSDGDTRLALFGMAVVASDGGKFDQAVQAIDREYAVAEKKNDAGAMAADLQAKGNILLEAGKYAEAQKAFDRSLQLTEGSNLSQEIKDNAALLHHFNMTMVAVGKKDIAAAKAEAEEFRKGVEASKNPAQIKQAHELGGVIALSGKNYSGAIAELEQANLQNPRNLYRLWEAYQGKGDRGKAEQYRSQVASFNPLPQLPYAFIRAKAQKSRDNKKG
ncbi:MAG TPA: tetratricopeptide repeat protein [Terriglobales bacterium]|nr:tetratricopeptide repeat protein [Terriglobales bacterium]